MSTLNADEQALYDVATGALPREFSTGEDDRHEVLAAEAKIVGAAKAQIDDYLSRTLIESATGIWLDQHAIDRGTRRQSGESNDALRLRLRLGEDTVTLSALVRNNDLDVRPRGTAGATSYGYTVLYDDGSGALQLVANGSTATGNASPDVDNFNRLRWLTLGSGSYKVYRTAGGATQGLIATVVDGESFDDIGAYADGASVPVYADPPVEGIVTRMLRADGVTIPPGYPAIVELRENKAWLTTYYATIKCVAAASISDGDVFVLSDGGVLSVFEFDKNSSITPGNIPVDISAATTAADVAATVKSVLDAFVFSTFHTIATPDGGDPNTVYIAGDPAGTVPLIYGGNTIVIGGDTVADSGFAITDGKRGCYLSRGYRLGSKPPVNSIVIMLPYGTSVGTAASIVEAVRQRKGAGIVVQVERSISP